jgi:hypothetical protein
VIYQFELFADESGTHDVRGLSPGSDVTVIIGYFNSRKNWDRLSQRWNTRLRRARIDKPFHMREVRNDAPYSTRTDNKRDKFVRSLAKLARDETWFAVGATLPTKDYDEIVPQRLKDADREPYFFCLRLFFDAVLDLLRLEVDPVLTKKRKGYRKTDEPVAFIFDQKGDEEFQAHARRAFNAIKALRDADGRMDSLTFGSRATCVPLQAADLMAYWGRRIVSHMIKGEAWRDPMELFLEERHNLMFSLYNRERLVRWVLDVIGAADRRILRDEVSEGADLSTLSEQMTVWNEWYRATFPREQGVLRDWRADLMKWGRQKPMPGDLWARLLEWKNQNK